MRVSLLNFGDAGVEFTVLSTGLSSGPQGIHSHLNNQSTISRVRYSCIETVKQKCTKAETKKNAQNNKMYTSRN